MEVRLFHLIQKFIFLNQLNDADNSEEYYESSENSFVGQKKIGFKNIDRSFTDLGYIGYNEGIHLHFLDTEANW